MKKRKEFLIPKKITVLMLTIFCVYTAMAKQIPTVTGIMKTVTYGPGAVVVGFPTATNLILVPPQPNAQDYNIQNTISLKYDLQTDSFFLNKTTLAVKITVDRWDVLNNPMTQVKKKLTIFIDNKLNRLTLEQGILKLMNGYKVQVTIDSIWLNGVSVKTLPKWASVESEINMDRYYDFSSPGNTASSLNGINQYDNDCDLAPDEIQVNWSVPSSVPEEYQLEWTHVNNYAVGVGTYPSGALFADFKNNSTRITTFANSYKISLLFDKGFIAFRVRAVGRDWMNPSKIIYGPWSSPDFINMGSLTPGTSLFQVITEHEKLKNWQYATTFAEEGKKKEVINYFDGSLHNRQTVTKINSDNNVIVGETVYDFQGRPAVHILPVPVVFPNCTTNVEPIIKYYPKFNMDKYGNPFKSIDFDRDTVGCVPGPLAMDTVSGASQYYSNNNPDKNNQQAFLPHAKKYPFTQIEYTPDNTGRIRNQSGVGADYKLGSGKETKYLYGFPNQIQVDRMFGSETGDASHYKKNVVIDANGQSSVTYLNQEGKTIATALAGIPPYDGANTRLDSLTYANVGQAKFTIDLFNKNALGQSILNTIPPSNDQVTFSSQLLVAFTSAYEFKYELKVDTVHDLCLRPGICFNCVYDLSIEVKDECGNPLTSINKTTGKFIPGNPAVFTTTCSGTSLFNDVETFTLILQPGVYSVNKILKINSDAKDFYVKAYLDSINNKCFKSIHQFQAEALAKIDTSDCYNTCASCVAALGSKDDYVSSGKGTAVQWEFLHQQCVDPCRYKSLCDVTYEMMLSDVSPGGQYGKFNAVTYDASSQPLSVYNTSNKFNENILVGDANWHYPRILINGTVYNQYLDENGDRTKIIVTPTITGYVPPLVNNALVYTDPNTLQKYSYPENLQNLSDFIPLWDPGFSKSLVLYHPEYAYYKSCAEHAVKFPSDVLTSDNLDSTLLATETFSAAVLAGFINANWNTNVPALSKIKDIWATPTGTLYDPFFTNSNFQYSMTANPTTNSSTNENMSGANPWSINLQSEMNFLVNNYRFIGTTPYTMADVAAIIARCGNNFGATPTATCMNFGKDYYPFVTPLNDSVRNKEWRLFRQFYFAAKEEYQWKRENFYARFSADALSNYFGGCNACFGTGSYNPWSSGMIYSPAYFSPPSAFFDASQPCYNGTYPYYSSVTKRFYEPNNMGLNTNVGPLVYQMTGQCPMAFQLQGFLNGMCSSSRLTTNTVALNTVNEFNPDLYLAVSGTPPAPAPVGFINYIWKVTNTAGTLFTAQIIDPSSQVKCKFQIDISGTGIPSFASITGITQLMFDPGGIGLGSFKAVATYTIGTSVFSANIKGDASCLDIKNCNFEPNCTPNQFASDMQALLSYIAANSLINSVTPVSLWSNPNSNAFLTPLIKSTLGTPNSQIMYQFVTPGKLTFFDNTNPNNKIILTLTSVVPGGTLPSVQTFANIRSNYNNLFKMDGMNISNVKINDIDGKAEKVTPTQTVGISMGDCSLPTPPECSQKEHKVRTDLERLVKEMLTTKPFNPNVDLYTLASLSALLQSYLDPNNFMTSDTYTTSTGSNPNFDTLNINFVTKDGTFSDCKFKLYHYRNDGSVRNFPNISNITNLIGIGTPDIAGNYFNFQATATYTYGTSTYTDVIYGKSCWPLKNCDPCPTQTVAAAALAKADSAAVLQGKAAFDTNPAAFALYKTVVDSVNIKSGWTALSPNYVVATDYFTFAQRGYALANTQYLKYTTNFDSIIDNKNMLSVDSFIMKVGNLSNCNHEYKRYVNATGAYNNKTMVSYPAYTLSAIPDSVFYKNHLCDSSFSYVKYLKRFPVGAGTPKSILQFFNITNPNPVPSDSCKLLYNLYVKVHDQFLNNLAVQANCKEANILHPLYSYDEIVKNNLCCSSQGLSVFNSYINSLATASIVCPPALPMLNSCSNVAAFAVDPGTCERYYFTMISKINQYNISPYAVANSYTLDPNIYPTFYSFQLAGYCDCVLDYINYLNTYIAAPGNSTLPLPKSIDEFPGCPHSLPPALDSCKLTYSQYLTAINNYNTFIKTHLSLGYPPINIIYNFNEFEKSYCKCGLKFIANLNAIVEGGIKPTKEEIVTLIDLPSSCEKPCNRPMDSTFVFPPYTKYDNPCVQQQINLALQNAANAYQQYIDSLTTYFANKYTKHCLGAFEDFNYKYIDKEYHFTLYYYDQAGNLVKTIPPEGYEPLSMTAYTDPLDIQVNSDRTFNQQNVFTFHRMATKYIYNSLNQLIFQSLPDHDNMDICDGNNPNGLDTALVINSIQFVTPNKGYLCGYIKGSNHKRGYVYTSNDGGNFWTKVDGVTSGDLQKVQFVNPFIGYAVSNFGMVFKTIDGGNSWDLLTGLYNPTPGLRFTGLVTDLYFSTATFGVVSAIKNGAASSIYYTNDGAATFKRAIVTGDATGDTITGIGFDGSTFIAASRNGLRGKLFKSTNGTVWSLISKFTANNLRRVQFVDNTNIFAVGEDGTLLKSTAPNSLWTLVPTSQTGNFNDIYFKNATDGVALIDSVPGASLLYKTFDGGLTWQLLGVHGLHYNAFQPYDLTNNKLIATGVSSTGGSIAAKILMTNSPFGVTLLNTQPVAVNTALSYADAVVNNPNGTLLTVMVSTVTSPPNKIYTSYNAQVPNPVWTSDQATTIGVPVADASFKKVLVSYVTPVATPAIQALLLTTNGKLYSYYKAYNSTPVCLPVTISGTSPFIVDITTNNQNSGTNFYAFDNTNKKLSRIKFTNPTSANTTVTLLNNGGPVTGNFKSIEMSNVSNEIIMVGDAGTIYYSTNVSNPTVIWTNASKFVSPVAFTDVQKVSGTNDFVATGIDGSLWKNTGGGVIDWQLKNSGSAEIFNSIAVDIFGNGLIAATNGKLYKISNAQTSSPIVTNASSPVTAKLTDVALDPGSTAAIITAANGKVLFTPNYVSPVASIISSYPDAVNGVTYKGAGSAVVVGNKALISNYFGSSSAITKNIFPRGLNSIHFYDSYNGFVIDSNDVIRHTANGGTTWEVVLPDVGSPKLNRIFSTKTNQGIIIGNNKFAADINNNILTTIVSIPSVPVGTDFIDVNFNKTNTYGVIVGSRLRAANVFPAGTSFNITYIGQAITGPKLPPLNTVHVFEDNSFITAGGQGKIFYYKTGFVQQMNYVTATGIPKNSVNFKDCFFHDLYTGYVVGDNGNALKVILTNSISAVGITFNSIGWKSFCSDALYMNYTTNSQKGGLDFTSIAFANRTNGMIGGADNNVVIAGLSPNKYSRLIKDQSGYYSTRFWYDKLGRLVVSQNTKQFNKVNPSDVTVKQAFSYTLYDQLGRIKEVGEKYENQGTGAPKFNGIFGSFINSYYNNNAIDDTKYNTWIGGAGTRREVTYTYYDVQSILPLTYTQNNLRKRVATSTFEDIYDANDLTYNHASHYSYDIHGNVTTLWQENTQVSVTGQNFKEIDYQFDLISGKVNKVIYSPGMVDQFIHKYTYDSDNRITKVETSKDDITYELDAKYFYYAHGPLARTEYGKDHVQGMDYAYTLQGWIKGVNSNALKKRKDMGRDGDLTFANPNGNFARDVVGYSLNYYGGDYEAIDFVKWNTASSRFEAYTNGSDLFNSRNDLFNGNISAMVTTISRPDSLITGQVVDPVALPIGNAYRYDQLNRIKRSSTATNIDTTLTNSWLSTGTTIPGLYRNTFSYDANGNIITQVKRDSLGNVLDSLTYHYEEPVAGKKVRNRLYHVNDKVSTPLIPGDIEDQGPFTQTNINTSNNYSFDEIGNLMIDKAEDIANIQWMVTGKIKAITRTTGSPKENLVFDYDAQGNRIAKHVYTSSNVWKHSTYYIRDAQGNVMSVYDKKVVGTNMSYKLNEQHLYGSSRIGMTSPETEMIGAVVNNDSAKIYLGKKQYELSNHLGNVLTVISDKKIQIPQTINVFMVDHYATNIVSANDYYPFGQEMYGRKFSNGRAVYGFNGKEKDNEVKGEGNSYDFKFRIYDPRLGKFMSIDPMFKEFPFYSPYQFASNNPILAKDLEGLETSENKNETEQKTSTKEKKTDNNKTKTPDPNATDPKTVGKNFDNSVYMGTKGNPKTYGGADSYEPKPQDEADDLARTHDIESGGIDYRSLENIKGDIRYIWGNTKILTKKAENTIITPYIGANPNKDAITGKPITARTAARATTGQTALTIVTAGKLLLAVTVDPAVKVYNAAADFVNDVKDKTLKGISDIQNWGN